MNTSELCTQLNGEFIGPYGLNHTDSGSVPFLYHHQPDSRHLLILLNGAVDRKRSTGPVFQRSSWVKDIKASVLNIADPTISIDNTLSIGWGQGHKGLALDAMSDTAINISAILGIEAGSRIYYGSSAGGYQAMQLGARDKDTQVIVNNPQTDWTYYQRSSVLAVANEIYDNMSVAQIRQDYVDKCSVISAMHHFAHFPKVSYYVNLASQSDIDTHLKNLITELKNRNSLNMAQNFSIKYYSDHKSGHNPLSREATVSIINDSLGKKPNVEPSVIVGSGWPAG